MRELFAFSAISGLIMAASAVGAAEVGTVDWSKVPAKSVTLFYPGQSTYDWLLSPDHKKGDKQVPQGKACVTCHEGDEKDIGNKVVKGGSLEPTPMPGKNGFIDLAVQAAHDPEYLYFRFQWKTNLNREGRMHDYVRFDGNTWKWYGHDRNDKAVRSGEQPPLYEDRLAIMLDDGKVPLFAQQGCWLTCHNGMRDTQGQVVGDPVKKHPVFGNSVSKVRHPQIFEFDAHRRGRQLGQDEDPRRDRRHQGSWRLPRPLAVAGRPVSRNRHGRRRLRSRVSQFRSRQEPVSWNIDRKTMTPLFMFDAGKVGSKALRAEDIGNPAKLAAIVKETNAVAFDPNAGWKEGDILPGRLLSRTEAKGSAADNDDVQGAWKDGTYTVAWRRKLDTGHPQDDKILKVGGKYTVGFAVHDDNVTTRFHHVSLPLSLGIGVDADIKAVGLK